MQPEKFAGRNDGVDHFPKRSFHGRKFRHQHPVARSRHRRIEFKLEVGGGGGPAEDDIAALLFNRQHGGVRDGDRQAGEIVGVAVAAVAGQKIERVGREGVERDVE